MAFLKWPLRNDSRVLAIISMSEGFMTEPGYKAVLGTLEDYLLTIREDPN
jgi:hypothetical protein